MDCQQSNWLSDKEYLRVFRQKTVKMRVPLSGSFALTHQCNLKCVHCYLGSQKRRVGKGKGEMSAKQVFSIIDEIAEAGCLHLLITGGEPLFSKKFMTVYEYAKNKGFVITVFSNGTLINDEIIELFEDLPPQTIEITMYGATPATHEAITRVKGSYERCRTGIDLLLAHKLNVRLKTILMTLNQHEFSDIENIAKDYGVKFRFDAAIFPCLNGNKTPVKLRVSPQEAIVREFADTDRFNQWRDHYAEHKNGRVSDILYDCGAGLTNFHIDPYGYLQPCLMTTKYRYCLLDSNFQTRWQNDIISIRQKKKNMDCACSQCDKIALCGFCPAFFRLESGSELDFSDYLCKIGQERYRRLTN